jgi:glycosyltransferase involved in cell wall biosynthesis
MRILYVAYPLLTVSEESAGGAEQVLWTLEREVAAQGMSTTVAASAGSRFSGELVATGDPCRLIDDFERRCREHQDRILDLVLEHDGSGIPFDLIHDMSGTFWSRVAEIDTPVLATLHLPRHFYAPSLFEGLAPNVSFNCVSHSQARSFADLAQVEGVVANGIALDLFSSGPGPRHGLLWLGRICEEKAPHLAIEIAARAGLPLTVAGQVYPFSYHRQYFEREIVQHLQQPNVNFMDSPSAWLKRRLLREAAAVLITSQVDETSSLVAMEAAASGTPVISFPRGALPEVVVDGVTGFLVNSIEDALHALLRVDAISPDRCVRHAQRNFSSRVMSEGYVSLYRNLLHKASQFRAVRDDKSSIPAV